MFEVDGGACSPPNAARKYDSDCITLAGEAYSGVPGHIGPAMPQKGEQPSPLIPSPFKSKPPDDPVPNQLANMAQDTMSGYRSVLGEEQMLQQALRSLTGGTGELGQGDAADQLALQSKKFPLGRGREGTLMEAAQARAREMTSASKKLKWLFRQRLQARMKREQQDKEKWKKWFQSRNKPQPLPPGAAAPSLKTHTDKGKHEVLGDSERERGRKIMADLDLLPEDGEEDEVVLPEGAEGAGGEAEEAEEGVPPTEGTKSVVSEAVLSSQ